MRHGWTRRWLPRPYFHAQLQRFVEAGFTQRLMFGSDSMIWPDALPIAIDAARFLRLSPAEIARHRGR